MSNYRDMPIGVYEKALPFDLSWKKRLKLISGAGYDFMEISIDESESRLSRLKWGREKKDKLKKAISATRIPIKTMCLSGHRKYPIGSKDDETRKRGMEIMKDAIQFAVDVGIRVIQLAGYDVYYEKANTRTRKYFLQNLKKSVKWASYAGVTLAIETMDTEFINSISRVMDYVEAINSPWLQVYPDIGNLSAWDQDLVSEFNRGKGHIVGVHIKDTVPGKYRNIPFGEGAVDFVNSFQQLASIDYQGPMVIEMWGGDNVEECLEDIVKAKEWVEGKMEEGWS